MMREGSSESTPILPLQQQEEEEESGAAVVMAGAVGLVQINGEIGVVSSTSSGNNKNNDRNSAFLSLLMNGIFACLIFLMGWYGPKMIQKRFVYDIEQGIMDIIIIPYQQVKSTGDIILDFEFNQPLIYPTTISNDLLMLSVLYIPIIMIISIVFLFVWFMMILPTRRNQYSYRYATAMIIIIHDLHGGICGFLTSIGISEGISQLVKLYVRRHRPNFYALCGLDVSTMLCTSQPAHRVLESMLSFPSGHCSLTSCSMTYIILFMLRKVIHMNNNNNSTTTTTILISNEIKRYVALLVVILIPMLWTIYVATTRLIDHWHHPADVIAGLILGTLSSIISYHFWYPPIWYSYSTTSSTSAVAVTATTVAAQQQQQQQQQPATNDEDVISLLPWSFHFAQQQQQRKNQ